MSAVYVVVDPPMLFAPPVGIHDYMFHWQFNGWRQSNNNPYQWDQGWAIGSPFPTAPTAFKYVHSPVPWRNITGGVLLPFELPVPYTA